MKITLFTSNKIRHNYLINLFSYFCDQLFVVQESEIISNQYAESETMKNYFEKVDNAQTKLFGNSHVNNSSKNITINSSKMEVRSSFIELTFKKFSLSHSICFNPLSTCILF